MDDVTKAALIGLVRDGAKVAGALLTAHGVMSVEQWQVISGDIQIVAGFLMVAIPTLWGIWAKFKLAHNAVVAGARAQARGIEVGKSLGQATAIVTNLSPKPAGQPGKT